VGTLIIPLVNSGDANGSPGLIVDGQQRAAAIREARVDSFPICVTAFIADDDREQREQFILVNSTKPLPKGLIYELLPTTEMKRERYLNATLYADYGTGFCRLSSCAA
jgi:DGQHR domain-containing protein